MSGLEPGTSRLALYYMTHIKVSSNLRNTLVIKFKHIEILPICFPIIFSLKRSFIKNVFFAYLRNCGISRMSLRNNTISSWATILEDVLVEHFCKNRRKQQVLWYFFLFFLYFLYLIIIKNQGQKSCSNPVFG